MKKGRFSRVWPGALLGIFALALAVRKVQWGEFVHSLETVRPWDAALATGFLLLNLVCRAKRWQILLRPFGQFSWMGDSFRYYMIGYMANMLLPFKAGEAIRPILLGRKHGVPKASLLITVVVERLADLIILAAAFAVTVFVSVTQIPIEVEKAVYLGGGTALALLVGAWLLARQPRILKWLESLVADRLPGRLVQRLLENLEHARSATQSLGGLRIVIPVALVSLTVWGSTFLTLSAYLRAFDLDLPWYVPIFVMVIVNFGMVLPSSPGAIGLAHFLYVFALSLFHVSQSTALGFAVLVHAIGFLTVVTAGLLSLWFEGLTFKDFRNDSTTKI